MEAGCKKRSEDNQSEARQSLVSFPPERMKVCKQIFGGVYSKCQARAKRAIRLALANVLNPSGIVILVWFLGICFGDFGITLFITIVATVYC